MEKFPSTKTTSCCLVYNRRQSGPSWGPKVFTTLMVIYSLMLLSMNSLFLLQMMSEDEYLLIVNAITSISLNFRRTVEVIECLNTYSSYPEFVISKPVHFCTDLLQFIFSKANNLYSVLQ